MRLQKSKARLAPILSLVFFVSFGSLFQLSSCQKQGFDNEGVLEASARKITTRSELIGGPIALGEVGDFLLENDKIRVIIQDKGYSRGFGVYGGSLIDADLVRPLGEGTVLKQNGRDQFGELFPVFFLQALEPTVVEVASAGGAKAAASVNVRGYAGNFITMAKAINQVVMNSNEPPNILLDLLNPAKLTGGPQLQYDVTYSLEPGKNFVKITTRITNITEEELPIPAEIADTLLKSFIPGLERLDVPMGFVILYGADNKAFAPGFGYNVRFALEDRYKVEMPFPALSGLTMDGIVSTSKNGVSYGFFGSDEGSAKNFLKNRVDDEGLNLYEKNFGDTITDKSMLLPFLASSFTAVFFAQTPSALGAGEYVEFVNQFVIGNGDVSSVMDIVHAERGTQVSELSGLVRDTTTLLPVDHASVIISDSDGNPISQIFTNKDGLFRAKLEPGEYRAQVEHEPTLSEMVPFTIKAEEGLHLNLGIPGSTKLSVRVVDDIGRPLPAKVTVTSTYTEDETQSVRDGLRTWEFLFDLGAGQHWRISDQVPDDPDDPSTLQFIEAAGFTEDGQAHLHIRSNREYKVWVSRGPEYNIQTFDVAASQTKPGTGISLATTLKRVVDTTGYISADFHIHAAPSIDSDVSLHDRVLSGAAEGLECMVATDHNVVTDYAPTIQKAGLTEWLTSMIGLELSTLESGHFNGYPLSRAKEEVIKGSFEWSSRPPRELFQDMRDLGAISPEKTLIQVNHARDSILGYFSQYEVDELSGQRVEAAPGFDLSNILSASGTAFFDAEGESTVALEDADFDVIEVLNGPILFESFHARMPEDISGVELDPEVVEKLPAAGTILCSDGRVAFPGVVDDWFNFLNLGRTFAGVANSDSHGENNLGYPRTYVYLDTDDPTVVTPEKVVDALKSHRATMSNGAFMELFANGKPIGSHIDDPDGKVDLEIKVAAPDWIELNEVILIVNGLYKVQEPMTLTNGTFSKTWELELNRDSWIVALVRGDKSLFPMVPPKDVPAFLLGDAFSSLAGPFGFSDGPLTPMSPKRNGFSKPLALTNPIWVNVDGNDTFNAPGTQPRVCEDYGVVMEDPAARSGGLNKKIRRRPRRGTLRNSYGFPRVHGDMLDIRAIFEGHLGHTHPH